MKISLASAKKSATMRKSFKEVMTLKRVIFFALMCLMILSSTVHAQGKKILYVPIDNRPCNLFQVIEVAEKVGYEILTPPEEFLGTRENRGDPEALWQWLNETAPQADAAVLSTDSLIYGSLIASRLHDLTAEQILERAQRFKAFHEKFPWLPIYSFGTIMRTPRTASNSSIEPEYYKEYGTKFFNYTALLDKQETSKLNGKERRELKKLEADIPKEYLDDWFKRRAKNSDANELFVQYAREGIFKYFLLGCDDSSMYSQTHRESRKLTELSSDLGENVVQVTSGADELGMLMIARAINYDRILMPFISVTYNEGTGNKTFPPYGNEPIGVSVDAAIIAVGGMKIHAPERADLVVVVNTRSDGRTLEAATKKNRGKMRSDVKAFMEPVKYFVKKGYPVAIADVAFANGSDNALMKLLKRDDLQYKIRAYGGWNTPTNTTGFLIGEGVLTPYMTDKDIAELLTTRYLDEWAYQANIRQEIFAASYGIAGKGEPLNLQDKLPPLEILLNEKMKAFVNENLILPRKWRLEDLKSRLPWQRTFECDSRFKLVD